MKQLTFALALIVCSFCSAQIKPTSASDRLKSIQQRKTLQQQSLVNHIAFRNIGPTVMSGRVVDIEVNEKDPTEFYVAYATGGLWHTVNNGQSFTSIFDSEDILTIGDIAVNWKSKTIWIGTGEVNSSRSSYAGLGIYKSNNGGKTWEYLGLPESHHIGKIQLHPTDNNIAWVAALGHLYSANKERGVYKTIDGGKTWKQTLYIDDNTGAVDIDINPTNPYELYASAWYRTRRAWNFEESGKTSGIYKSTDGGDTWSSITKQGAGFPTGEGVGRIGVAVSAKNPQVVYAVLDNQFHKPDTAKKKTDSNYVLKDFKGLTKDQFLALDSKKLDTFFRKNGIPRKYTATIVKENVKADKLKSTVIWDYLFDANEALFETPIIGAEIYRSDDAGKSWKKVNQKDLTTYNTYGYYFGKIYVSPSNENKIVITGFNIEMSTDGGKTFKNIAKENVHPDHHACWINPNKDNHIIEGNDGGCNITYDDGQHWFKANTPAVGQFYGIALDNAKPYNVYGGLQDNGTWFGPSNNKENYNWYDDGEYPFRSINGGDGMQVQVDTRDNKTVYSGFQFGFYSRRSTDRSEPKPTAKALESEADEMEELDMKDDDQDAKNEEASQAPGDRPVSLHPRNDLGEPALRFNWQTPILLSQHNQDVLYYGSNRFHRSLNKGDTLPPISADLTTNPKQGDVPFGTLTTITESPLKFGLLYIGTDDGNIQVSKDGGYTFANVYGKLPKGLYVSRVIASAFKEGRVYASLNGYRNDNFLPYLYVSDDYGTTWKQIGKDLPNEPINVIREDTKYPDMIYVGTDGGLYVSINAGNTFMAWTNGLPKSVPIHDMLIHSRDNELVLGTHGRSIYVAKLDSIQLLLKDESYRTKKQKEAENWKAALNPKQRSPANKKEGIDIDCPPVAKN